MAGPAASPEAPQHAGPQDEEPKQVQYNVKLDPNRIERTDLPCMRCVGQVKKKSFYTNLPPLVSVHSPSFGYIYGFTFHLRMTGRLILYSETSP